MISVLLISLLLLLSKGTDSEVLNEAVKKFHEGLLLMRNQDLLRAREAFEMSLALNPDNVEANVGLGLLFEKLANPIHARMMYEQAIQIGNFDSATSTAHHNLGMMYIHDFNDYKKAREYLEIAMEMNPRNYQSRDILDESNDMLMEGQELVRKKDFDRAQEAFKISITLNPNNVEAVLRLGKLFESLHESTSAQTMYEKAISIGGNDLSTSIAYHSLGMLYLEYFKDYTKARNSFQNAIKIYPLHHDATVSLANLLQHHFRDFDGAREHFEKAINLKPEDHGSHHGYAILLMKHFQEYENARQAFQKALECDPENASSYQCLAFLLENYFHEYTTACEYFKLATYLDPKEDRAFTMLGHCLERLGDDNAFDAFDEAMKLDEWNLQALSRLIYDEKYIELLRTSASVNLNDPDHFRHAFYLDLRNYRPSRNEHPSEQQQFIRPLVCRDVKTNFQKLTESLTESSKYGKSILRTWVAMYINMCSESCTIAVFQRYESEFFTKIKHLASLMELIDELRRFVISRNELLDLNEELIEKLAVLSTKYYTMEREVGGPYWDINAAFQDDNIADIFEFNYHEKLLQPTNLVSFGFQHLYRKYRNKYGIQGSILCWRGMNKLTQEQWDMFETGFVFYWPSYVSTTLDMEIAFEFCRLDIDNDTEPGPNSVLFEIELPHDAFALSLESISALAKESEVLLFPYHKFCVVEKYEFLGFPGRGLIHLQCQGCAFSP